MNGAGTAGLVVGCISLATLVGAGGTYFALHELRPPPKPEVIRVQVPFQVQPPAPAFGPVPHVTVNSVPPSPTPAPTPAVEPAPAVIEKPVVKSKPPVKRVSKQTKAQRALQKRWSNVKR
jgi:hypothetical protein